MINVEDFLLPISSSMRNENLAEKVNECGRYLKYDHVYDEIKEYRREDDPRLNQGIWQTTQKKASWIDVKKTCETLLKTQTKDLQIAVWLLESLTMLYGFAGLNHGILLIYGLSEKFWDIIYPEIDWENRNMAARMAPFYFFAEKMQDRILSIPLTNPIDGISSVFSLSDWISSRHNLRIKSKDGLSAKELRKSVIATPLDFFEGIESVIDSIIINLKKLDKLITTYSSKDSPSFQAIYDLLYEVQRINIKNLEIKRKQMSGGTKNKEDNIDNKVDVQFEGDSSEEDIPDKANISEKPTLEQAYSALEDIAVFLENEQPQSPSSTLLRIANSIGKKTFQELMDINLQSGANIISTISELYKILK